MTEDLRTLQGLFASDETANKTRLILTSRFSRQVKCPVSQFKCRSGKCVAPSSLCDGVKDCDGEEDEENCGQ